MSSNRILDKFRGAMVGAVIGDALGSPLEFTTSGRIKKEIINKQFAKYRSKPNADTLMTYTDDTAMARQVARSLIKDSGFNASDMAQRFVTEYFDEPNRGYGRGVIDVFVKLNDSNCEDPFTPAKEQFDGTGSYGNGGAMRVHPVSLLSYNQNLEYLADLARATAKITHANADGYNGAILQAYAVYLALHDNDNSNIVQKLQSLVTCNAFEGKNGSQSGYVEAMEKLKSCLSEKDDKKASELGNDVTALMSVPVAIYSFLRVSDSNVEGFTEQDNKFAQTLQLAFSFGGDTDTIGSMAGAMAGAAYGLEKIPYEFIKQCEGTVEAKELADKLFDLAMKP